MDPLPTAPTLTPDPVVRYAQYLKDKYKRMPTLPDGDWPPSLGRQYTRLAMIEQERKLHSTDSEATIKKDCVRGNIDKIIKSKKAIQLPEIFLPTEDGGQELKILMDGAPGVGKSTLSRKVCKDWASGELLQQYHLVILLPLRLASIEEATSIDNFIQADDLDLKKKVVQHIRRTSGEHVMLIVDGYDELSYHNRTNKNLLFLDIVQGYQFPKCSVLVTSRPYASGYLQHLQSINRHVEVLGFTEKQIEQCITVHKNIPDKFKTKLVQALKERQDIASLCYIPLNCAIVLCVYETEQFTIPNNLTKLYESFILNSIKRRITCNDSITTMAEIPESVQKHLDALSKLAYDGLVADKMVFSVKDIKIAFPDCSDLDDISDNLLSLMTAFKGFTSTGEELSYHFLHLTIQEFLAARWAASQLSGGELLKFFQDHLREDRYRMVLLFLAGISQLKFPSAEDLFRETLDFKYPDLREYSNRKVVDYFLFFAHLIYESQNFSLFHNLAGTIVGAQLFATSYHIAPFDCLVLAHFLALCDCSLKLLDLSNCGLTSKSIEIMHKVNLEHCGTTQIEEVDLSNNPIVITKLSLLSKLPMFEHMKVLKACGLQCPVEASCVVDLLCLLNMRHLTTLKVSAKALSSYFPSLDKIYLSLDTFLFENGNIDSQNAVDIFKSLEHTSLEKLNLSENSQLAEGDSWAVGCAIEKMLNVNRTLKRLNLSSCELDTAVITSIFRSLQHNTSLEELDLLENNQLGDSEAVGHIIERMLNVNRTLKRLNLSVCELDTAVTTSIFRSLGHNTSLEELDLSENNQVGDSEAVGCAIERMLNVNRTLKVLNLSCCNVTYPTAKHISTGLINNTSLVTLDIQPCTLSLSCAVSLLTHPTVRITVDEVNILGVGRLKMDEGTIRCENDFGPVFYLSLNKLRFQCVKIDSQNAVDIFKSLEHNTSLEELDLSENSQLAEGDSEKLGCAIERMLNGNRTLKVLNLSGYAVTDPVVKGILTGLTKNTSLVTLNIGSPTLSGSCVVSLFQQMTTHPTLTLHVGEVNVLAVGRVKMDRGAMFWCVISDLIPENCVEFFRALNNSGVKVSKLNVQDLTDQTAELFAVGLAESQSVQALKLNHCFWWNHCSTGAVSIFKSLEHNTSLEELDLSESSQLTEGDSEEVSCAIERMLNVNTTLKLLNLAKCGLSSEVASSFSNGLAQNHSVRKMILHSNNIGSTGAVSIFISLEHNTSLEELDLSENGQLVVGDSEAVGCAIERMLNVNRTLKLLNLAKCDLSSEVASSFSNGLAQNHSVRKMILHSNNIGSTGAVSIFRSLEHNTSLEELDLSENSQLAEGDSEALGCAIERMLNGNRTLKVLNLSGYVVTDPVVKGILTGLTKNTSLVTLNIGSPTLSGSCVVSLFQQMTTHPTLTLHVGEVNVLAVGRVMMDRGAMFWCVISDLIPENCVEFFRALNSSGLKVSNLDVQDLTDQTAEHFAVGLAESQSVQALKLNHCFWWNHCSTGAVSIFKSLEHNTSLEELDLSENSKLTKGDSEAVGCAIERMLNVNRTLKLLNLAKCDLSSEVASSFSNGLAQNHSVRKMILHSNNIGSTGAVSIFRSLEYNTSLEELDLSQNSQLVVGDSEAVGCAIERMLNVNRTLKVLNLSGCGLNTTVITLTTAGLAHNACLTELDIGVDIFSRNNITSEGWVLLFKALCNNTSLKKLDISGNNLRVEGSVALAEMLSCNKSLTELNLRGCDITEAELREIARGLLHNTSLKKLDISQNYMSFSRNKLEMEGSVALAEMLSCNKSLTELNLRGCDITEAELREIARGLLHNTSLKKLDISQNHTSFSRNKLGMEGSVALAEMLSCNKSLTELNLRGCDITEAELREIARGLLHNTSLKKLDISQKYMRFSRNKLGIEGSVPLAEMLSCNKSLTELNLWGYDIFGAGLRELARGLLQNTSLQTLTLWPLQQKVFLEAEIERLKKSGIKSQSSSRLEIKTEGWW